MNPNLSPEARAFLTEGIRGGGVVTDGPLPPGWAQGWAVLPFMPPLAHWWRRDGEAFDEGRIVSTLCGLKKVEAAAAPLLGVGSFENCARCDAAVLKTMKPRMNR